MPVYRWMPPEDIGPVDRLLDATVSRGLDALTFTSAPAAASLLSRAEERGLLPELLAALNHDVLPACVGPVTALPLQAQGVDTVSPERFRLGPLVQLLCKELPGRARTLPIAGHRVEIRGHAVLVDGDLEAGATGRDVPVAGPDPRPGWVVALLGSSCGRCPVPGATSTPWRRRWLACGRPWGRRS
ncbi:Uroporphyrinogen-III synthase OS=Streptomyces alboniger OX=132473 GN=CP975_13355 PE=4 SV=1 [Streptomyces alboniger]